ncbi:MAG: hypothetical protein EYC70_16885 [Planctomycetota bacterium]|nr:MAG: hypothetical protein EYC70_16885 [Planctomycetota bacterium]
MGGRRYLRLFQAGPWGDSLFVKEYGAGRRALRQARSEFAAAAVARRAGAPAVRAWAALEAGGKAWLLCQDAGVDAALDRERAWALCEPLAESVAMFHAARLLHGDLHVRNALRASDGAVLWTDLRRLRRLRRGREEAASGADLGHLLASLLPLPPRALLHFGRAYLQRLRGAAPAPPETKAWAAGAAAAGWKRFREHQCNLDRRARRQQRREQRGLHPQVWRQPALAAAAPELEAAAAAGHAPLKLGDRSSVVRVAGGGGPLVVKHFRRTKALDPRDALGRSKALRNLDAAERLLRRGFPAAQPLAAWSRPGAGSWLVLEDLPGHLPLHEAVLRVRGAQRAALLRELARLVRRLHLSGVAYRDLKPSNLLVDPERHDFILVDHDRNRFLRRAVPPELARRDLAALHAGLPPEVRASERLRALRAYDPRWSRREMWRAHVRPLLREAARRRHRWMPRRLLGGAPQP